jgi:hypothetical protein
MLPMKLPESWLENQSGFFKKSLLVFSVEIVPGSWCFLPDWRKNPENIAI